jgi:hypothetical protein
MPCRSSCWCRRTISRKRRRTRFRTTAPPTRPEVTNPARHTQQFSIASAFSITSLPRCVIPFRFTRSYSERCVSRHVFGNDNELTFVVCIAKPFVRDRAAQDALANHGPRLSTKEIFHRKPEEDFSKKRISALLRRRRLRRCFLGASRRIGGVSWSFGCSGTRHFSRRRGRSRGSWTCRRSDSFSFLLARREKRGSGQNADVFLHS